MILKIDNLKDLETKKIKLDKNLMSICVFGNEVGKYYDLLTSIHQTCKKNNIYLVISTVEESLNAVTSKFDKTDDLFFVSYSEKDLIKFPKLLRYLTPFFFNTNQFHYRDSDSLLIKKDIEIFEKHDFNSFPFLIIRDHLLHYYPVMAGMFSVNNEIANFIAKEIIKSNNLSKFKNPITYDQDFLCEKIYRNFLDQIYVYSSSAIFSGENFTILERTSEYIGRPQYLNDEVKLPFFFKILKKNGFYFLPKFLIRNSKFFRARFIGLVAIIYRIIK